MRDFRTIAGFALGVVVTASISAGATPSASRAARYLALDDYAVALTALRDHHVDAPPEPDLIAASIAGMAGALDTHSGYLPGRKFKRLTEETIGEQAGVGVVVAPAELQDPAAPGFPLADFWPRLDKVWPGSPAFAAGLRHGDRLVRVDKRPTAAPGEALDNALDWEQRLEGAIGTQVEIEVWRPGEAATRVVTVTRAQVTIPTVEVTPLAVDVTRLAIASFTQHTVDEVRAALRALPARTRIVLDLRGNPGGLLEAGIATADLFLAEGTIMSAVGRTHGTEHHRATPSVLATQPMVVLVDEGTASAAEVLAAALQENLRAQVVGTKTYGKASAQTLFDLPSGAGVKVTTARFLTPNGKSLEGQGLIPDVEEMLVDDLGAEEASDPANPMAEDSQLRRAFEMLQSAGVNAGSKQ